MTAFLKSKIFRNFSYLTVTSVISQLLGVITILKISKFFPASDYGLYSLIFIQAQLVSMIGDLGLKYIVIRKISRDKLSIRDVIINGIKLRLLALVGLYIFYQLYNMLLGGLNQTHLSAIFIFSFLSCFSNLFENAFFGRQDMIVPALLNVIFIGMWTVFVFVLPATYFSLNLLILVQIISGILKVLCYYWILGQRGGLTGTITPFRSSGMNLLKESWPYFAQMLLILPVTYLSYNFLDINSTREEIAYFNIAQKITSPATLIFTMAFTALFPNLSHLWFSDRARCSELIRKGSDLFLLPAALLCFLFTVFIPDLFPLFFDIKYLPAVTVSQLQIWYVFFMGVNTYIGTVWGAANKERLILKSSVVNALLSTPMLYVGSHYGSRGLAFGYLSSFILFELYLWRIFCGSIANGEKKQMHITSWFAVSLCLCGSFFVTTVPLLSIRILFSAIIIPALWFGKKRFSYA